VAHSRSWFLVRAVAAWGFAAALAVGCLTPVGYDRNADGGGVGNGNGQGGQSAVAGSGGRSVGAGGVGGGAHAGAGGTPGVGGHGTGGAAPITGAAGTSGITGAGGSPPPGTVLYMDDFAGDSVGSMASGWIQGDTQTGLGSWMVASDGSNVLQGAAAGSDFTVDIGGNASWTDYTFQVDAKMISGTNYEVGVYGRFAVGTDKGNFYEAYMDDSGSVQLRVKLNGSTTTLGSKSKSATPPALNTTTTFRLDMHGSTITVYVNGVMRVMATDATLAAGGIGVIVEGGTAEFDNVLVTE
jgi:hypothetical protein